MKNNSFSHLYKDLDFRKKVFISFFKILFANIQENFGLIYDIKPKNEEEEKKKNISNSPSINSTKIKPKRGRRIFDNEDQRNITKSDVFE